MKRCCPDYKNVCSKSLDLFSKAQATVRAEDRIAGLKPRVCWRKAATAPDVEVRSSFEVGGTVKLSASRQRVECKYLTKHECACENAGSGDIDRSDHEPICNRTLVWIVRVPYETQQANGKAYVDSVRLCMADAARLWSEYRAHKAKIVRVYPLYATVKRVKRKPEVPAVEVEDDLW